MHTTCTDHTLPGGQEVEKKVAGYFGFANLSELREEIADLGLEYGASAPAESLTDLGEYHHQGRFALYQQLKNFFTPETLQEVCHV